MLASHQLNVEGIVVPVGGQWLPPRRGTVVPVGGQWLPPWLCTEVHVGDQWLPPGGISGCLPSAALRCPEESSGRLLDWLH